MKAFVQGMKETRVTLQRITLRLEEAEASNAGCGSDI